MKNICIFIGQIHLDTQRKVILSIFEECKRNNINLHVCSFYSSTETSFNQGEFEYINRINLENYDGFILYAETIYSEELRERLIEKIRGLKKHVVSIDYKVSEGKNITSDNVIAYKELIRHLIEHHDVRKINFISGPADSYDSNLRLKSCEEVLEEYGLTLEQKRIFIGDFEAESGSKAIDYYAHNGLLDADAYVCANDGMAVGAYYDLKEKGLSIPEDALITGFDDIDRAVYSVPGITSIKRNEDEMGKSAFYKLIELSMGRKTEDTFIPATPVYRGTCCKQKEEVSHEQLLEFYNKQVQININQNKFIGIINDSTAEFCAANNIDSLCELIPSYLEKFKINEFCLCLDTNDETLMDVPLHYVLSNNTSYSEILDRSQVIPELSTTGKSNLSIIIPLHYMDKYFGYVVTNNFYLPLFDEVYKTFINNISNSIEAIYAYNELKEMYKKLEEVSKYDPLTHLYNRRGFFDEADVLFEKCQEENIPTYIIFIDLDGLKSVNDNLGHKYGDMFLIDFADILRKVTEKTDNITMRFGGDEFVIFGKLDSIDDMKKLVDEINKEIEISNSTNPLRYGMYKLGASMGSYEINPETPFSLSSLIDNADREMYNEKKSKKALRRLS